MYNVQSNVQCVSTQSGICKCHLACLTQQIVTSRLSNEQLKVDENLDFVAVELYYSLLYSRTVPYHSKYFYSQQFYIAEVVEKCAIQPMFAHSRHVFQSVNLWDLQCFDNHSNSVRISRYNDNNTEEHYRWNHFRTVFFSADKNIES